MLGAQSISRGALSLESDPMVFCQKRVFRYPFRFEYHGQNICNAENGDENHC